MNSHVKLIRCTRKLLNELNTEVPASSGEIHVDPVLGEWYCNLLYLDKRRSLLFTSADTLYTFVVPQILKRDLETFDILFAQNLRKNLEYEGLSVTLIERIISIQDVALEKTISRSVLGSMNDYAIQSEYFVTFGGGLKNVDILELNRKLNSAPMSAIGMKSGIKALLDRVS